MTYCQARHGDIQEYCQLLFEGDISRPCDANFAEIRHQRTKDLCVNAQLTTDVAGVSGHDFEHPSLTSECGGVIGSGYELMGKVGKHKEDISEYRGDLCP